MSEVRVPQFAEGATRIRIVAWLKQEGDLVAAGETIAEASTGKIAVLIEAPAAGRLAHIRCPAGAEVEVGQVLATIE